MFKRALVSVTDKSGLIEFLKPHIKKGLKVVSTGGTAKHLEEYGIPVLGISEQTGFPEVMDGRVKTLHPKVHMALLAREGHQDDINILKEFGTEPFDLVIGNLYEFGKALTNSNSDKDLIEYIDIGGPSFLRAAAKNFERVTVICQPQDYQWVNEKQELVLDDRKKLAAKVFSHTSAYDSMIAAELASDERLSMENFSLGGKFQKTMRYGENPSQSATWFSQMGANQGWQNAEKIQGKDLSYNNLLDLEAALRTLRDFPEPTCISLKHNNPCGIASHSTIAEAVELSLKADPVSVFGGIVAINKEVDRASAEKLSQLFLECIVAPSYSKEALEVFSAKKNLRVLRWPEFDKVSSELEVKTISGGFLVQQKDVVDKVWNSDWKVVGNKPNVQERAALLLAWKSCKNLKSNAIAIASDCQTLGLGMGQVNRVDAVEQAIGRKESFHPDHSGVVALASDAFFPFPDSIEKCAQHGIKWVIQPGGSIKDDEVLSKAKELGVNLILTGKRHFLH